MLMKKFHLTVGLLLAGTSAALAQTPIDPATIHVGSGQGTPCVTGGCPIFNSTLTGWGTAEVNSTGSGMFDLYLNENSSVTLSSPVLAILAVPTAAINSLAAGTLTAAKYFSAYSTSSASGGTSIGFASAATLLADYGLTVGPTGLVGDMTGSKSNIYSYLQTKSSDATIAGLFGAAPNSFNMTNLTNGDATLGVAGVSDYGIYAFGLNTTMVGNSVVNVDYSTLPVGTYILGFGYQYPPTGNPNPYATPITEAAVMKDAPPVPEPASMLVFGTGLLGLGVLRRRVGRSRRPIT